MIWHVPHSPQVVVATMFRDRRQVIGWQDTRRWRLTLGGRTVLIPASPFPFSRRSVRFADVTGDGHADLLVTVLCSDCNHATAALAVFTSTGRRIYGFGFLGVAKGGRYDPGVRGKVVDETAWGARRGLVWIDEPGGGVAVCCPAYRLQTFLRWTGRRWRVVDRHRAPPLHDRLVLTGYPSP